MTFADCLLDEASAERVDLSSLAPADLRTNMWDLPAELAQTIPAADSRTLVLTDASQRHNQDRIFGIINAQSEKICKAVDERGEGDGAAATVQQLLAGLPVRVLDPPINVPELGGISDHVRALVDAPGGYQGRIQQKGGYNEAGARAAAAAAAAATSSCRL